MERRRTYDIILYGATSHTSKFIIPHLLNQHLNIAVSARDTKKIENYGLPTLNCEIQDIDKLTKNTKVLLNCVGPYILTGEEIIKSCIKNKTHYLDISGETAFVNKIREKYDEEARKQRIYIVNCCGFDSIPADIGTEFLKDEFKTDVEIESTITVRNPTCNKATWVSLIHSLSNYVKPIGRSNGIKRREYNWSETMKSYRVIFRGIDHSIVKRTQELFQKCGRKSAVYSTFLRIGSFYNLFLYFSYLIIIQILSKFSLGRMLLIRFYRLFSCNIVVENPSKEVLDRSSFEMLFIGSSKGEDEIITKQLLISGPDPGLNTTGICASQCALSLFEIHNEQERRSHLRKIQGGAVTPGFVFKNSNLVTRLRSKGIKFEFI